MCKMDLLMLRERIKESKERFKTNKEYFHSELISLLGQQLLERSFTTLLKKGAQQAFPFLLSGRRKQERLKEGWCIREGRKLTS